MDWEPKMRKEEKMTEVAKAPLITLSEVIKCYDEFYVEIYIGGQFWDHRQFLTRDEAEAFRADPLSEDRKRSNLAHAHRIKRQIEEMKYRAFGYEKISTGRKIGRKPGAA
jgi:hypothetical protein